VVGAVGVGGGGVKIRLHPSSPFFFSYSTFFSLFFFFLGGLGWSAPSPVQPSPVAARPVSDRTDMDGTSV